MEIAYILPVSMKRFGYSMENYLDSHFSVEIAREVANQGHKVTLHTFWDKYYEYHENGLNVYFYPKSLNSIFKYDFSEISLDLLNKNFSEDTIFHFHEPNRFFYIFFRLKHLNNKFILEHHGSGIVNPYYFTNIFFWIYGLIRRFVLPLLLGWSDYSIVHNITALNNLKRKYSVPDNKVILSPNGIDPKKYKKYEKNYIRNQLGIKKQIVILFAGRICKAKGILELIQAYEAIKNENLKLIIAGPLEETELKPCIEKYWIGFQNKEQLQKWFSASDIFCLPTHGGEGLPVILIEASYYNQIIVVSDVPGIKEWFGNKQIIYSKYKDITDLTDKLNKAIGVANIKNNNLKGIDNGQYMWKNICSKYISLYKSAVNP